MAAAIGTLRGRRERCSAPFLAELLELLLELGVLAPGLDQDRREDREGDHEHHEGDDEEARAALAGGGRHGRGGESAAAMLAPVADERLDVLQRALEVLHGV